MSDTFRWVLLAAVLSVIAAVTLIVVDNPNTTRTAQNPPVEMPVPPQTN